MTPVKKIEIVADAVELEEITRALERHGVSGYTVIRDIAGTGGRGRRWGDELGASGNSYVMTACAPEMVQPVIDALRPILTRFGGVALVSDAMWVQH